MKQQSEWCCWLQHPLILCSVTVESDGASEGRQQECGGEVVIRGETEGGGGEISAVGKRLAFNREEIKEV